MHDAARNIQSELKSLRLNGMASAWGDRMEQDGGSMIESSRWLIEHLLQAEVVDRHMRSIAHQMKAARFPIHRDLAGFDFDVSQVDKALIKKLADLACTEDAQNVVPISYSYPQSADQLLATSPLSKIGLALTVKIQSAAIRWAQNRQALGPVPRRNCGMNIHQRTPDVLKIRARQQHTQYGKTVFPGQVLGVKIGLKSTIYFQDDLRCTPPRYSIQHSSSAAATEASNS